MTLRWRHNEHAGVSNHQPHGCLLNRLFRRKSKKTSKLRVTGLCAGNSPGTGEFPAQMASYAENVSIWWRHHDLAERKYRLHPYTSNSFLVGVTTDMLRQHLVILHVVFHRQLVFLSFWKRGKLKKWRNLIKLPRPQTHLSEVNKGYFVAFRRWICA